MDTSIDWNQLSEETRDNRRDGKRVTLNYGLEVRGSDETGAFYACAARTRNVSEHGCCFETGMKIRKGEVVSLQVVRRKDTGEKQSTHALIFRICWVIQEGGLWVAGAEMAEQEKPWGIDFPAKKLPPKSA